MKNTFLLLLALSLITVSCKKETDPVVEDTFVPVKAQWGFVVEYTATWCGPCGSWGAPLFHELIDLDRVVGVTAHASSDPMYNAALFTSFESVRTTNNGIPAFWIGDNKTTEVQNMQDLLAQTPIASIILKDTIVNHVMTVDVRTDFYTASEGEYYLSVLVLESGISGTASDGEYGQAGTSDPDYHHDCVLRASATEGNVYGELAFTNPKVEENVKKTFTITLNETWTNDVFPVAILWRKNESSIPQYEFINAVK